MTVNEKMNTENRNRNRNRRERRRRNKKERSNLGARPIEAAAVSYSNRQSFPNKGSNKSRRITSSELVGSIVGSTTFNSSQKFSINPGLAASFPWLAPIAAQWQQYCFHKLQYRYVTRSSTASTGSIYLSPDYNLCNSDCGCGGDPRSGSEAEWWQTETRSEYYDWEC